MTESAGHIKDTLPAVNLFFGNIYAENETYWLHLGDCVSVLLFFFTSRGSCNLIAMIALKYIL